MGKINFVSNLMLPPWPSLFSIVSCLQIVVWLRSEILCLGSVSNYGHVNKIPTCVSSLRGGLLRKVLGDCELLSELLLLLSFCHFLASSESFFLQNFQNHDGAINIVTRGRANQSRIWGNADYDFQVAEFFPQFRNSKKQKRTTLLGYVIRNRYQWLIVIGNIFGCKQLWR